jgi:hypothetical protein
MNPRATLLLLGTATATIATATTTATITTIVAQMAATVLFSLGGMILICLSMRDHGPRV